MLLPSRWQTRAHRTNLTLGQFCSGPKARMAFTVIKDCEEGIEEGRGGGGGEGGQEQGERGGRAG